MRKDNITLPRIIKYIWLNIQNYGFYKNIDAECYEEGSNYCLFLDDVFVWPTHCRFAFINTNNTPRTSIFDIMKMLEIDFHIVEHIQVKLDHECYYKEIVEIRCSDIDKFKVAMTLLFNLVHRKKNADEYDALCTKFIWPFCQCINKINEEYK